MRHPLLLALLLAAATTEAGVVSRDLFEPGDGLLTYDDVNGREWLDFSVSSGLLAESDSDQFTLPPELSDFRLATLAEVEMLLASEGVVLVEPWTLGGASLPTSPTLIELLGTTLEFSGSILGTARFSGGLVAPSGTGDTDAITAVLAFTFGDDTLPGALNRSVAARVLAGHYQLTAENYPFTEGAIDIDLTADSLPGAGGPFSGGDERVADDINGNGNAGSITVIADGEVIAIIPDFGDLFEFNVFFNRVQGAPALWLVRNAVAVPEPSAACLALMACLAALRLRAFA